MLTISKPLSAGQAQSYHQKESYRRSKTTGHSAGRLPASGRVASRHSSALPVRSLLKISRGSARASTQ